VSRPSRCRWRSANVRVWLSGRKHLLSSAVSSMNRASVCGARSTWEVGSPGRSDTGTRWPALMQRLIWAKKVSGTSANSPRTRLKPAEFVIIPVQQKTARATQSRPLRLSIAEPQAFGWARTLRARSCVRVRWGSQGRATRVAIRTTALSVLCSLYQLIQMGPRLMCFAARGTCRSCSPFGPLKPAYEAKLVPKLHSPGEVIAQVSARFHKPRPVCRCPSAWTRGRRFKSCQPDRSNPALTSTHAGQSGIPVSESRGFPLGKDSKI
jgi:hypothetical protein